MKLGLIGSSVNPSRHMPLVAEHLHANACFGIVSIQVHYPSQASRYIAVVHVPACSAFTVTSKLVVWRQVNISSTQVLT